MLKFLKNLYTSYTDEWIYNQIVTKKPYFVIVVTALFLIDIHDYLHKKDCISSEESCEKKKIMILISKTMCLLIMILCILAFRSITKESESFTELE
jgi:hypothetical protein